MKEWIISDTHFGHSKIIQYCERPFKSPEQMDEAMIRKWIGRVKPDDIIYHLGDVGLTSGNFLERIVPRLTGKKILILGNHDKSAKRMMEFGFDFACESMVVQNYNKRLYLTHRPLAVKPADVAYVLHGHIHNSLPEHRRQHEAKGEIADIPDFNINLSVEMINYEPVPLDWVVKRKIFCDKTGVNMEVRQ